MNPTQDEDSKKQMLGINKILKIPDQKRILIVDDEPFNILGMQITLKQLKIRGLSQFVDRAFNGLEALKKVKQGLETGSHIYGLILTDISMPVMDGFEETEGIRNFYRTHNAPQPMIVACTGHVEDDYIKRAWACEIDEVIPKPISVERLSQVFKAILWAVDPRAHTLSCFHLLL